eukprot:PLAT3645.5.p2 GENE.PLAT3645.5~~PLAT3645.5.p2  ORF type:complete len:367 (+),score=180.45 PLAT3645.5:135-1235(+)
MARRRPRGLKLDMPMTKQASFDVEGETFVKGKIAIGADGVVKEDSAKTFTVDPDELEYGEIVGRGCSSYVQRGVHVPTGTQLALKVINMFDKGKRDQLMREVNILYDSGCPCIVTFYGAYYREGAITIALEFMDGGALSNVLAQVGCIPESTLANICYNILWGLAYLKHEKRVHRDIKPSNILINSSGEVKLSDFGVSAELQNSIAMCATFVGTFKYMSPERIRHMPYSYASDIWSLGLVLLECATGVYPYEMGETSIEMIQLVLEADEPTLDPDEFSPEFCDFASQCLQKDPEDRLPADILLGSPWLEMHGAVSVEDSVANIAAWIEEIAGGGEEEEEDIGIEEEDMVMEGDEYDEEDGKVEYYK